MANDNSQKHILAQIAKLIRKKSNKGNITKVNKINKKDIDLSDDELSEKIDLFKNNEQYEDIRILSGEKGRYLFSDRSMTKKYAKLMAQIEENNIKDSIAETVREDSKIYPRPTDISVFEKSPFNLEKDVLDNVIDQLKENNKYKDIKEVEASNGALYLYSDKYMEQDHAVGLTEWVEVIRKEIP